MNPSKASPTLIGPYNITKAMNENDFELIIPPFVDFLFVFNVELAPYFPPLLHTSKVVEHLAHTKLKTDCIE
jgi:hypothetical protein